MGQRVYNSSLECAGERAGLAFALAVGVMVAGMMLGCVRVYAESPAPGLIINRNGDVVSVHLDSQASHHVSIRRSDDVMTIKVPESFDAKLLIDPRLQKDNVVQEADIPSGGKMITITSSQIDLITQEHLKQDNLKNNVQIGGAKPTKPKATVQPVTPVGKANAPIASIHNNLRQLEQETARQPSPVTEPVMPIAKKTVKSKEFRSTPRIAGSDSASRTQLKIGLKAADGLVESVPSQRASRKKTSTKPTLPTREDPFAQVSLTSDPESQPLDLSGHQQSAAGRMASYTMFRIVLSLLTVLGLLLGFVRILLPKLMARYPEFFERLKRRYDQEQPQTGLPRGSFIDAKKAKITPVALPETPAEAIKQKPPAVLPDVQPAQPSPVAIHPLSLLSDSPMTVLGSTSLGDGKELHLVDVQGRQLVIATTPSSVSFLTDLTDESEEEAEEDTMCPMPEPPKQISGTVERSPQVIAYMSDESTQTARKTEASAKTNPYAAIPHTARPKKTPVQSRRLPDDRIYQKYLQPPASYVDAEEVIVLEDYDDVYGF